MDGSFKEALGMTVGLIIIAIFLAGIIAISGAGQEGASHKVGPGDAPCDAGNRGAFPCP